MGSFRIEIEIDREPHVVFAVVSDVHKVPLWYEAVQRVVALAPGAPAVGARYEMDRALPGGHVRNEIAITEYEPDRLFTVESRSGPTPFRYRYTLESAQNKTRLTLDGSITGAGLPGPVARFDAVVTGLFKRGMRTNLEQLRRLVESEV